MKCLAVEKLFSWSLVLTTLVVATPVSAQIQVPGGRQPLNQLPPIVSPNGSYSNAPAKKSLFLPPIVQGNRSQVPSTMSGLPPIVQGKNSSGANPGMSPSGPATTTPGMLNQSAQPQLPPIVQGNSGQIAKENPVPLPDPSIPRVSTAGVPIYPPTQSAVSNVQFTGQQGGNIGRAAFGGYPQGSDTRNSLPPVVAPDSLSPAIQQPSSTIPNVSDVLQAPESQILNQMPRNLPNLPPSTVVESPVPQANGIVDPAANSSLTPQDGIGLSSSPATTGAAPGTNDYFANPSQPLVSGGQIVDNSCSSCGENGCYNLQQVQSQFGCCGSVVSAGYYVFADALVWTRADGDIQFSNSFGLNNFSWEGGLRFTLGYRRNATLGREFTYFGTGDLDDDVIRTSATNSLSVIFNPAGGFGFAQVSGFATANFQEHQKSTSVHSLELNRVEWGWDVFKSILGLRYIYMDDDTQFFSTNGLLNHNALFTQNSINNLLGAQTGFELFYDVGYRASASLTTKGGVFLNVANVDTNLFNFGQQELSQEVDEASIASSLEIGVLSHFQLRPKARLRLGYDVMLMWGIFTVENNIPRTTFDSGFITGLPVITPLTGSELNTNNDVVAFHGLSFGFEFYR